MFVWESAGEEMKEVLEIKGGSSGQQLSRSQRQQLLLIHR